MKKRKLENIDGKLYVDGEEVIYPTIKDVRERFDIYNQKYFKGKLSHPTKFVDYTATNTTYGSVAYIDDTSYFSINIRGGILWTEEDFSGVIIHEMIHLYIGQYHKFWKWLDWMHYTSIFLPIYLYLRIRYNIHIFWKKELLNKWDLPKE